MPLFISDEELRLLGGDVGAVAERADAAIRDLRRQVDTVRAEADSAAVAAEQTCALLEQRYADLSYEFARSQAEASALAAASERHATELSSSQAEIHQLQLQAIARDNDIERLRVEVMELQKSKRQLLELIERKDAEITEKDSTIRSYHDKIVNLADVAAGKEARVQELEVKLANCHATCNRVTEEKELLERHNLWLDEEYKAKVKTLAEMRKSNMDEEAKMSAKIADLEREMCDSSSSLRRSKERISELEQRIYYLEKELCSTKDAAAAKEQRLGAELSTVAKLAELHKESSEEWSKKAGELEGVIKALETHLIQVEDEYKEKLEEEASVRKELETETTDLKQKLEKCESELENARKSAQLSLVEFTSIPEDPAYLADTRMKELISNEEGYRVDQNDQMIVPKMPSGISGTALATSLLRDGWSLAKMYEKYQETNDALRHERWGRRHAETVLERVLHEIEEKAELILDERAEHERLVEAYSLMNQKLQQALQEHENFENIIRNLKSELKKRERDHSLAEREMDELQKQVTVLLKECIDIQRRCGSSLSNMGEASLSMSLSNTESNVESTVHEHMTFKDISGLVRQNAQLRNQVHILSADLEKRDVELREGFQIELQKVVDEAASRVEAVTKRSEEQGQMIESLHRSVAMYRRLCEEQSKTRSNGEAMSKVLTDEGKKDIMLLFEGAQDVSKKAYDQVAERARNLEEELNKLRSELVSLRSERDKAVLEADFARDHLNGSMAELEHQRKEANSVSARNAELMHLVVVYQKKLRESSDSMRDFEDSSRKLSLEVSILKHEKEMLVKSEKRALDEVQNLTERVHRLQGSLDTIHTTQEIQENARASERRRQEEHIKQLEGDWAELKKELQEERDRVRILTLEKCNAVESYMKQLQDIRNELHASRQSVTSAESRAAIAEAKCSDLEGKLKGRKIMLTDAGHDSSLTSSNETIEELFKVKAELEKYKEEAQANKNYMLQYKEIANLNEVALKQMESAHQDYKAESEISKKNLEDEILNLRSKLSELEKKYILKSEEVAAAMEAKEKEIFSLMNEISVLRNEVSEKVARIETLEIQLSSSKSDFDEEHKRWRNAQDNYERQVILQSETIQELTNASNELSSLQQEIAKLRQTADAQKAENDALRTLGEQEKLELRKEKDEAQRKCNELNDQNKILHNRLEALHIQLAEKQRSIAGYTSQSADSQAVDDLHGVISYLRRSKEIAETEVSLLKQEKSRLQIELESAMDSAKEAQGLLRAQADSTRAIMFKDEEFRSLQLQVREINLLRESNIQLREENKHNFEECQKLRDEMRKAKIEADRLHNLLIEKEVDAETCRKELAMQKVDIENLNHKIAELVENSKGIGLKEYENMKDEVQNMKSILKENADELEQAKNLLSEREMVVRNLEEELTRCQSELNAKENKLNDVEASLRSEIDRQKKISFSKKKYEILMKEKEDVVKDNQSLLKQIEDLKSTQKTTLESAVDQAIKEKDFRIQTLEKILEKERDDNKKEKANRKKAERVFTNAIENVAKEKKQVEEAMEKHKQAIKEALEHSGIVPSEIPSECALDEQAASYFFTAKKMEDSPNPFQDGAMSQSPLETSTNASASAGGRQVVAPSRPLSQVKVMEERAISTLSKQSMEPRRPGRRPLVRPTLERTEETHVDTTADSSTAMQEEKTSLSLERERETSSGASLLQSSTRKRLISFSQPREDASQLEAGNDAAPSLKKFKEEPLQGTSELKNVPSPSEEAVAQGSALPSAENIPIEEMETDQASLPNEEVEVTREEDVGDMDEMEEQLDAPLDSRHQEVEVNFDTDATTLEDIPGKSEPTVESFDEDQRIEDGREEVHHVAPSGEDEREEGEMLEEPEQQEGTALGGNNQELKPSDRIEIGEQAGDAFRAASPGGFAEKSDIDTSEEIGEGDISTDNAAVEPDQSPQVPSGGPEGSPSKPPDVSSQAREASPVPPPGSASSEQQNLTTTAEADDTRSSRTIILSERARQNREARMAQAQSQAPAQAQSQAPAQAQSQAPRGRGRASSGYRKDAVRGSRGRGGRGQT